jgi:hypothetical protein
MAVTEGEVQGPDTGALALAQAQAQEQGRVWRAVAEERERALEELERVNRWLEEENARQECAVGELQGVIRQLREQVRALSQPAGPPPPCPAPPAGLVGQLKAFFPRDSLRGRVVRQGARLARRLLKGHA